MGKKKKNPIVLFLLAFVAIVIFMLVSNYRSIHVQKLNGPRAGVERLSTCGEVLVAISKDKDVYTWRWDDLSGWPQVGSVKAQKAVAMSSDRLIWVPSSETNVLVVSNLKGDKELKRLPLPKGKKCNRLGVSPNGKYAVIALDNQAYPESRVELAVTDSALTSISQVVTKSVEDRLILNDIGISDDGSFVAAVGRKDGGWILVGDVRGRRVLWEQSIADTNELNNVVFSPDGQIVYASEPGRFVYAFEVAAQRLVKKFEMDKYKTPPNNPQTILCVAVSPDGRLLAAASGPFSEIWIWDVQTGAKVAVIKAGQVATTGTAFSPDSSLLAAADLTTAAINIWKVSE
jgi:WD40 repeat protein